MPSQLFRDYLSRIGEERAYIVGLLTVTADGYAEPLRFNSTTDREVLSRGDTYFRSGFDFRIPDRNQEGEERSAITLPVVDAQILSVLRSVPDRLSLTLEVVLSRTPDTVELGPYHLVDIRRVYDASSQTLAVECSFQDILSHPRPRERYTPSAVPGLFGLSNTEGE